MKIDIFNIDDFIKINKLEEITSPIGLTATKMPNPDGIFSYEIFGYTTEERKNNFAYINLRGNYFHPQCIKVLGRMGVLAKIVNGNKYAIVADKKIVPLKDEQIKDFPDAKTGPDFFYENWDNINWSSLNIVAKDTSSEEDELSIDKKNRLKFFKYLKKEEAFVRNWLVLPPYYRDFNTEDSTMGDDVNKIYKELLLKTMSLRRGFEDDFGFSSVGVITRRRIQDLLCILYDMALGPITGKSVDINTKELKGNPKRSLIRKNLIGRTIEFSASSVITSPVSSATETVDDFAKFGEVRLPLQSFMAMAKPFFIHFCQEMIEDMVNKLISSPYYKSKIKKIDAAQWSVSEIDKGITRFIKSASDKDEPILIKFLDIDGNTIAFGLPLYECDKTGKVLSRRVYTYLDLYYQAAVEISKDKYSINTRHPIANNQNIYPAKIVVLSTNYTRDIYLKNDYDEMVEFKHYPYISYKKLVSLDDSIYDPNPKSDVYYDLFRATIIGNGCIKSLGADYDGDMMFFRCLFTKEANEEAKNLIWKKTNWFSADGSLSRGLTKISKDCTISLYEITKD